MFGLPTTNSGTRSSEEDDGEKGPGEKGKKKPIGAVIACAALGAVKWDGVVEGRPFGVEYDVSAIRRIEDTLGPYEG